MQAMKTIVARRYGRPANWGRCFSVVREPGLCDVGERVNVTLADKFGSLWRGVAECFCVTPQSDGRTVRAVYDFEKLGG